MAEWKDWRAKLELVALLGLKGLLEDDAELHAEFSPPSSLNQQKHN